MFPSFHELLYTASVAGAWRNTYVHPKKWMIIRCVFKTLQSYGRKRHFVRIYLIYWKNWLFNWSHEWMTVRTIKQCMDKWMNGQMNTILGWSKELRIKKKTKKRRKERSKKHWSRLGYNIITIDYICLCIYLYTYLSIPTIETPTCTFKGITTRWGIPIIHLQIRQSNTWNDSILVYLQVPFFFPSSK